eukprot:Sspe_Gene.92984::Locus_65706_Transcript_4_5_Confidence_0.154_Length_490::g.92984::m.92984
MALDSWGALQLHLQQPVCVATNAGPLYSGVHFATPCPWWCHVTTAKSAGSAVQDPWYTTEDTVWRGEENNQNVMNLAYPFGVARCRQRGVQQGPQRPSQLPYKLCGLCDEVCWGAAAACGG